MDAREYVELLKKHHELVEINEEVDWNLEIGAYTSMASRVGDGKSSVLFNNIKGYGPGNGRIHGAYIASSRKRPWARSALALGMDPNIGWKEYRDEFIRRFNQPIKPMVVEESEAPCKENKMIGKDVDLLKFPWPFIHQTDGGRYSAGFQAEIIEDPDTGWVNWGCYRLMVLSKNRHTGLQVFGQHGPTMFYTKYEPRGIPAPYCYIIGGDPAILYASGSALPAGICEADYVGALRQEPTRVVRAETNKLFVPADAEIVIEGEIMPGERADEGPVGEYTGYVHSKNIMPVFSVHAITYRNNPILTLSAEGISFNDNMTVFNSIFSVEAYQALREAGFPVTDVRGLGEVSYGTVVIATEVPYAGYIRELTNFFDSYKGTIWGSSGIIVDADVDISGEDMSYKVYQEMAAKCDPKRDIYVTYSDHLSPPLSPMVPARDRLLGTKGCRWWWNCTTPRSWTRREKVRAVDRKDLFPKEILSDAEDKLSRAKIK
ncbi:UbiD-like decarboxylase [subsurface metagenome]